MMHFRSFLEFAARTPVLAGTGAIGLALVAVVFPSLPVGGELLDARFGYTFEEAVASMAGYGDDGRRVYAWASLTLDTLLPLSYVGFLGGLCYRLRPNDGLWILAFLPVAAGALDLGENVQIAALLVHYPNVSVAQVAFASLTTQLKACAVLTSLGVVAVLAVLAVVLRTLERSRQRP